MLQPQSHKPRMAVLIKTHFLTSTLLAQLESLQQALAPWSNLDLCLSLDLSQGEPPLLAEAQERLDGTLFHGFGADFYLRHGFQRDPYGVQSEAPLNWYHSDYSLLDFYLQHPGQYAALWQIEYDVSLRLGTWDFLAQDFHLDFMASSLKVRSQEHAMLVNSSCLVFPQWFWWQHLSGVEATVGSFFPCIRLSAPAAEHLVQAYRSGITGYCEVSVPSSLACAGAVIGELSAVDHRQVQICHPHWDKHKRQADHGGFVLNTPCLNVDQ